jgi:5-deoxy-glucuronate isomerase
VTAASGRAVLDALVRSGETAGGPFTLDISPVTAGWSYSGLRIVELEPGGSIEVHTGDDEILVLPLGGSCAVACAGALFDLTGRDSVFTGVTDFAYAPRDARVEISSRQGGRFAIPSARASRRLPPRYVSAESVAVELRGAGSASRQVSNFCAPDEFDADRLIAVEVLTPGGNWSSYPPHKHDESSATESQLEEIYYFEVRGGGPAYQRVYSSGAGREIDVLAEVTTGDAVLIRHGYHGPSMAAPGYDLYYLNVMAGPGERAWRFTDDPAHAWIRGTWADQRMDPRLPLTTAAGQR